MAAIHGSWRRIANDEDIRRSSQTVSLANGHLNIFGGEIQPRQPVDNKLYRVPLNATTTDPKIDSDSSNPSAPTPRVGSASTTLLNKTYLFSGRGGEAMAPIEERGALHALDAATGRWSLISPADPTAPFPPARSYHAMASDGAATIYVHAGCPETGRLADLWAFDLARRTWTPLAAAPGPARGGTSLAYVRGKLYRMNGFDGRHEQGFALDAYEPATDRWTTKVWDAEEGPSARSVSVLLPMRWEGSEYLVTMFGECDPSSLGHQGAGRMLDDVWAYDVEAEKWARVEAEGERPQARGWFAADVVPGTSGAVVHGGLAEDNTRLGDVWMLTV